MDLSYFLKLFIFIGYTSSLTTLADSSEEDDDSCEDSNSSDYDTLCERFLQLAKCRRNQVGVVCGSNRVTYRSEYQLARAACSYGRSVPAFRVSRLGSCPPITRPPAPPPARNPCDIRCTTRNPVCGSDGHVYSSPCSLRRVNCLTNSRVSIVRFGGCITVPVTARATTRPTIPATTTTIPPTPTTRATTPVITTPPTTPATTQPATTPQATTPAATPATTQMTSTRRTPPQFGGNNTPQSGRGDTPCNDNCPDGPADGSGTVCGSDGVSYETECHLLVAQCQVDRSIVVSRKGPCLVAERLCPPTSICPREYLPICGTGNITYPSLCHFQIDACLAKDSSRKVLLAGECPQDTQTSCPTCPPDLEEVCGTDNVTYSSACALTEIACRHNRPELAVAYLGRCPHEECPDSCSDVVDPVCATNGNTYISLCALSVEACKNKQSVITVAYRGKCAGDFCNVQCPDIYEPLCDNKGTTYQNTCQLWIAICMDPSLSRTLDQEGCNLAIP